MLSRVANSLFWMNRYIERAENTARIVDVNLQLLLDFRNLDDRRLAVRRRRHVTRLAFVHHAAHGAQVTDGHDHDMDALVIMR